MRSSFYFFTILYMLFFSCGNLIIDAEIENTPENNFDILWKEFDKYYAFFDYKKIDWDSLYTVYRPQVKPQTTHNSLQGIMVSMLENLKDGHVSLYTPYLNYVYRDWYLLYPHNYNKDIIEKYYLGSHYKSMSEGKIIFNILNGGIGYIHISSFEAKTNWVSDIDKVLEFFKDRKGLIIDVRDNGGGSMSNAAYFASRFADEKRLYAYTLYRNGPGHSDFTEPIPRYIEPSDKVSFTKPVAVLTNRRCFSAAESFVLAMRLFPHVTVLGDITGGGSGTPLLRELPNGWVYQLSTSIQLTPERKFYEGTGLEPDISVINTNADPVMRRETILERAIHELRRKIQ